MVDEVCSTLKFYLGLLMNAGTYTIVSLISLLFSYYEHCLSFIIFLLGTVDRGTRCICLWGLSVNVAMIVLHVVKITFCRIALLYSHSKLQLFLKTFCCSVLPMRIIWLSISINMRWHWNLVRLVMIVSLWLVSIYFCN